MDMEDSCVVQCGLWPAVSPNGTTILRRMERPAVLPFSVLAHARMRLHRNGWLAARPAA